jgi:hypothetical protein
MIDQAFRKKLLSEAFALLARAEHLLDSMRARYEQQNAEQNKKAA